MKDLFYQGGPLFMGMLTLVFVIMVVWVVFHTVTNLNSKLSDTDSVLRKIGYTKSIGLFALVMGIFGQLLGIYHALTAIEQAGDISPSLVFSGLKISMIAPIYGIIIFLISLLLWFVAALMIDKKE